MNTLEAREAQWANLYSQRKKIESWDENYTSGLGKYENQNLGTTFSELIGAMTLNQHVIPSIGHFVNFALAFSSHLT